MTLFHFRPTRRRAAAAAFALISLVALPTHVLSAGYPARPIRMLVGFPPGGSSDIAARIFADSMARTLGQPVIVDNRPGVGGNVAAAEVIRAPADGYTIFYATSAIVLGPLLYPSVKYDALRDFTPVALTATNPLVMVVNNALPPRTLPELIAYSKGRKDMNYASTGAGTMTHLPSAAFVQQFGIHASHVPYKGASPAMVDLASGTTQFMISALSEALPMLQEGRIRPLAITSNSRSPLFPGIPTFNEALGTTDWVMGGWQAIVLPRGASPEIVGRLEDAVNKAVADPAVKARFAPQGTEVLGGTPAQLVQFIKAEQPRWKKIIEDSGARAE